MGYLSLEQSMGGSPMGTKNFSFIKTTLCYALTLGLLFPSAEKQKKRINSIHDLAKIINKKTDQSPDYFLGHKLSNLKKKTPKKFRSYQNQTGSTGKLSLDDIEQVNQKLKTVSTLSSKERLELFEKIDQITETLASRNLSQSRDDTWLRTEWNYDIWDSYWLRYFNIFYYYNENNLVEESFSEIWNSETETLDNWGLWHYSYDDNANQTQQLRQYWNGSDWENNVLYSYTYDENGNQIENLSQYWDGDNNDWNNQYLTTYSYDENGSQIEENSYHWNQPEWLNSSYITFVYDENGKMIERIIQNWDDYDYSWINDLLYYYSYDNNDNLTNESRQTWTGSDWENNSLRSYAYDENGNQIEELIQYWSGSDLENEELLSYAYDENGSQIEYLSQYWNGSDWENDFRYTYVWQLGSTQENDEQTAWEQIFGAGGDYGWGAARSVEQISNGDYIVAGYVCEYDCDFWVARIDESGNVIWENTFGGDGYDYLLSVKESSDGNLILSAGTSSSEYTTDGSNQACLLKMDQSGEVIWLKTFEGELSNPQDWGKSVQNTSDGGFIIAADGILIKTDSQGNMEWESEISYANLGWGEAVRETPDGGYIVIGNLFDYGSDILLRKVNNSGEQLWEEYFGSPNTYTYGYSVQNTSDGGFIISGYSTYLISNDQNLEEDNSWLLKVDGSGVYQWDNIYGPGSAWNVHESTNGGYVTSGNVNEYYQRAMITKTDYSGNIEWQNISGADNSALLSIIQSENGGFTAAGHKNLTPWLVHVDDDGIMPENPEEECGNEIDGHTYLGDFQGSCYYLSDNTLWWFDAKQAAEDAGGHLATITSDEERSYLVDVLGINLEINPWGPWIGLSDHEQENDWRWVTGEPFSYTNWSGGEPGVDSPENHATWSTSGWHDHPNERDFNYILEVPGEPNEDNDTDFSRLFFSEYGEGSSNNKYLEIYNNTGQTVNLDDIVILGNYNGNPWTETFTFEPGALVEYGQVYVIASDQADDYIKMYANETHAYADPWYICAFNGDDIRALARIVDQDTTILDMIGTFDGGDPGDGWNVAGVEAATKDHTLVRKDYIEHGNGGDWVMSAGSDYDNSEWVVLDQNNWDYIGDHPHDIQPFYTANITFAADMSELYDQGWNNEEHSLELRGELNGWQSGDIFEQEDPYEPNIFTITRELTAEMGSVHEWKFKGAPDDNFLNNGWEPIENRFFEFNGEDIVLEPVFPALHILDEIPSDVLVEIRAEWREGTLHPFTNDPFSQVPDTIIVNGSFLNCWCSFGDCMGPDCQNSPNPELPRLTDEDGDLVYTGSLFIPAGHGNIFIYKLGAYYPGIENEPHEVEVLDNEAPFGHDKIFTIDIENNGYVTLETVFGDNNPANDFLNNTYTQEEPSLAEGWSMVTNLSFEQVGETFMEDSGPRTVIGGMDMDQDGVAEMIVTEYSGHRVIVMEFDHASSQFNEVWSSPYIYETNHSSSPRTVGVGDLDNDGKQEIVFPSSQVGNEGWHIYEWDGNVGSDNYGTQPSSVNRNELDICCPDDNGIFRGDHERTTIEDIDNDGKQELVIMIRRGSPRGTLITSVEGDILHNGGGLEEWVTEFFVDQELYGGGSPYHSLPADLNGDGHTDLVNHTWNYFNFYNITSTGPDQYLAAEPGTDGSHFYATDPSDQVSLFGGDAADIDGDGNDEAYFVSYGIWGEQGGDVYVVDYDNGDDILTVNSEHVVKVANGIRNYGAMGSIYDVDGNGLPNILTTEYPAMVRSLESDGNPRDIASYSSSIIYDHNSPNQVTLSDSLGIFSMDENQEGAWMSKAQSHFNGSYLDFDNDGQAEILLSFQGDPSSINIMERVWNLENMNWDTTESYDIDNQNHSFIVLIENENLQPSGNEFVLGVTESGGIPGDTVTVSVWAEIPEDYEMFSYQVSVTGFGGNLLNFESANTVDCITPDNWLFAYSEDTDNGIVITAGAGADGLTGSGNIFNLNFVLSETIESGDFVELFILEADINEDNEMDLNFVTGGISVLAYGDVSVNGTVTPYDASLVLQYLVGTADLENAQIGAGDVTLDNTLSALDAAKILDYTVGIITSLPVDEESIEHAQGFLNIPGGSYTPGDVFSMPILLESGENIRTFELEIGYDPEALIFQSINWDNSVGGMSILDTHEEGLVRVSAAGIGALASGSFSLGTIDFEMSSSFIDQQTVVTINRSRLNEENILINEASAVFTNALLIVDDWGVGGVPEVFSLEQNFPNPFNPVTQIRYQLPEQARVSIVIYDAMGREVKNLVPGKSQLTGFHQVSWNATNNSGDPVSAGMYIYSIQAGDFRETRKMVLIK